MDIIGTWNQVTEDHVQKNATMLFGNRTFVATSDDNKALRTPRTERGKLTANRGALRPYNFYKLQSALTSWEELFKETGGALKPETCFYYMVDYEWLADSSWQYTEMVYRELFVPCVDGSEVEIEQHPVDKSRKTLGIWTNPVGNCSSQLEALTTR